MSEFNVVSLNPSQFLPPDESAAGIKIRKFMGHSFLRTCRLREALEIYLELLTLTPNDPEILCVIGTLYLLSGNPKTAQALYALALQGIPDSLLLKRQAAMARAFDGDPSHMPHEVDPLAADALERLIVRLLEDSSPEKYAQIAQCAEIANTYYQYDPMEMDCDWLMPALIDLSMRQTDGMRNQEITETLRSLQVQWNAQRMEP